MDKTVEGFSEVRFLDGKQLYYSFLAGAKKIFEEQGLLNKINVFPVADADTGTNLASTMRSIIGTTIPTDNIKTAAVAIADAALVGARGNSGIIFAQFLYGFSNEIASEENLDTRKFAEIIRKAVTYAYEAIANPVEGTMITVIKAWADCIYALKDLIDDFIRLIIESYQKAMEAVAETTNRMEVLKKANVVDAGAKGFVFFLEGMVEYFKHQQIRKILAVRNVVKIREEAIEEIDHDIISFRYCAEALITGEGLVRVKVANRIKNLGDSMVIAGSPKKLRIHLHTDKPTDLFSELYSFGTLTYQKVDDMVMQNQLAHHRRYPIGILTDSCCDLPKSVIDQHQIQVMPLSIHFGETFFLDRLTLNPQRFLHLLETSPVHPTTAQPTYQDFANRLNYAASHFDSVIAIHMTSGMSGTYSACDKAARDISENSQAKIDVIDSHTITGGLGMIILRVIDALEKKMSHDELVSQIPQWTGKISTFMCPKTMKYAVRGGRVSPLKGKMAQWLRIKPIIGVNMEGKSFPLATTYSDRGRLNTVIRRLKKEMEHQQMWGYTITHVNNFRGAEGFAAEVEKISGKKPLYMEESSPVLAAHTGPGTVCLSVLYE